MDDIPKRFALVAIMSKNAFFRKIRSSQRLFAVLGWARRGDGVSGACPGCDAGTTAMMAGLLLQSGVRAMFHAEA
jgi:hypothetical protein